MKIKISTIILIWLLLINNSLYSQWVVIEDYFGSSINFKNIEMTSDNTGYITARTLSSNILLKTINGSSWDTTYIFPNSTNNHLDDLFFINDTTGYAIANSFTGGEKIIYKTNDGGITFTDYTIYHYPSKIFFPSNNIGYVLCSGNYLLKTIDSGSSWSEISLPFSNNRDLFFLNDTLGFISVSDTTGIYKTTDGGLSWDYINIPLTNNYDYVININFTNDTLGFLNSKNELWKTVNSGNSWLLLNDTSFEGLLKKVQFLNEDFGYAFGYSEYTILNTSDGGITWTQQNIDMSFYVNYYDMTFLNENTGYVIGGTGYDGSENAIVLKTENGGFNPTNLNAINHNKVEIYPNPAKDFVNIKVNNKELSKISIIDISGRIVKTENFNKYIKLATKYFEKGIYIFKIETNSEVITRRILID